VIGTTEDARLFKYRLVRQGFLPSDFPYLKPLLDGARLVHLPDLAEIGNPYGARTGLFVPLRKDDALLGRRHAGLRSL
jgi:hypothetical protein